MQQQTSWLPAFELATVGAVLYIIGLTITALHNIKFSILAIDLLRPQAIAAGLLFVLWYFALPALILFLRRLPQPTVAVYVFVAAMLAKEVVLWWALAPKAKLIAVATATVQIVMFAMTSWRVWRPDRMALSVLPAPYRLAVCGIVLLLLFAVFLYGAIPAYVGGGGPLLVNVITDKEELAANRFMLTRNAPAVNKSMPSFKLNLLYESDSYLYFVAESHGKMKGYSVMRLSRDQVLRMDYVTPFRF